MYLVLYELSISPESLSYDQDMGRPNYNSLNSPYGTLAE